ncbi:FmdB family zinc ribbon protein [Legionella septentrionalis]|uniref:FmdB family zinc ribbon protein n=1 Tax=Legionella septentrionalis TaxID=2498109 RepID=UPI000F8D8898|nr:zinc ribbon domain-containing protein [Legionella septentrionalis]RUQ97335.1 zinc ribbon domain-containing protein [Legionella septentrionalis]
MPIYEYQCAGCHHKFDLMQKITDEPAKKCPQCFEDKLLRLVSPAGFQLKGTGWYVTDFKNKGTAKSTAASSEKSDAGSKSSSDSSSTKKGETD